LHLANVSDFIPLGRFNTSLMRQLFQKSKELTWETSF